VYRDDMEKASELVLLFALSRKDDEQAATMQRLANRLAMHARGAEVTDLTATVLRLIRVVRDLRERLVQTGASPTAPADTGHGAPLTREQWDACAEWLWKLPTAPGS
jgi:hypothetical protein